MTRPFWWFCRCGQKNAWFGRACCQCGRERPEPAGEAAA